MKTRKYSRSKILITLIGFALIFSGCGEEDNQSPSIPTPQSFEGEWWFSFRSSEVYTQHAAEFEISSDGEGHGSIPFYDGENVVRYFSGFLVASDGVITNGVIIYDNDVIGFFSGQLSGTRGSGTFTYKLNGYSRQSGEGTWTATLKSPLPQ